MKTSFAALAVLALLLVHGAPAAAQHDAPPRRTAPWPERTLQLAAALPLQDGGRVKPLDSYASFTLLRFNGKRSVSLPDESKLEALPWLLDVLFFPEQSAEYAVFKVDDVQAVEAIGVDVTGKKKRDRYSYRELDPGVDRLFELAREYHAKEERDRTPVEQQVVMLASSVGDYLRLQAHFDWARYPQSVEGSAALEQALEGSDASYSRVLAKLPKLLAMRAEWRGGAQPPRDAEVLERVLQTAAAMVSGTETLAMIPPSGSAAAEPEWRSPADLFAGNFQGRAASPGEVATVADFESLARAAGDPARFELALGAVRDRTVTAASTRGEYRNIPLELTYYRLNLIENALVVYIVGFVLCAVLWLVPRSKWLYRGAVLAASAATALLVGAIVLRCVIRGRPPVSTLYETLLFVTAVGSLMLLVTEWINRQRVALSVNTVLGMAGLFLANAYETLDKKDTMPQLVAVLDTNFWLATHVTAITVGYAAGMVAATIGSVWLVARLLGIKRSTPSFGKNLIRMAYGTLCFGLIFAVVGTILGGIWANESWGRFWGWDPKENGALLICLTEIAILHGRMGGYLRDFGLAAATAFLGTVIAFSWFGVNLLGVGLHSYGFTSGIQRALWSYYLFQWGLIAVCCVQHVVLHSREAAKAAAKAPQPEQRGGRAAPVPQDPAS